MWSALGCREHDCFVKLQWDRLWFLALEIIWPRSCVLNLIELQDGHHKNMNPNG